MALGEQLRRARTERNLQTTDVAAGTRIKLSTVEALEREDFSQIAAPIYARGFIKLYAEFVGLDPRPLLEEFTRRYLAPLPRPSLVPKGAVAGVGPDTGEPQSVEAAAAAAVPAEAAALAPVPPEEAPAEEPTAPARPPPPARPLEGHSVAETVRDFTGAEAEGAAGVWSRMGTWFGERWRSLREPREEAPGFTLPRVPVSAWPLRSLPVILGLAIVLICVASCMSRCVRSHGREGAAAPGGADEMHLAFEPPDPYLE